MLCDYYISPMRFMHTDSSVMRLAESMRFVNQKSESSKYLLRIVVFKPHYPKYPVNYPFSPLTAHSDIRITTRIGIYTKYLVNLYFRTIDLSFGIANLSFRIDSGKFGYATGILGSTPPVEIWNPLQWKLGLTPAVEIWY